MAFDLIFKKNMGRNWSREAGDVATATEVTPEATSTQKIAKLKAIKAQAEGGDKKAQKKWAKICKKIAKVQVEAKKGNAQAAQNLITLRTAGIIPKAATVSGNDRLPEIITSGNDRLTEIVSSGREEILGSSAPHRDDIEMANDGGSSERQSLARLSGDWSSKFRAFARSAQTAKARQEVKRLFVLRNANPKNTQVQAALAQARQNLKRLLGK